MAYSLLIDRLRTADPPPGSVVLFPDGSVDVYYEVHPGRDDGRSVRTRERFGELIAGGPTGSFRIKPHAREMGGQAVNTARQCHALDLDVRLLGHLDHPVFEGLEVPNDSFGTPAMVHVFDFEDEAVMLAEESADIATWTLDDLLSRPAGRDQIEGADVIVACNWMSVPGMDDALDGLSDLSIGGTTVVFDPGDLTGTEPAAVRSLLRALESIADRAEVVLSVNGAELEAIATAVGVSGGPARERVATVRSRTRLSGVVVHAADRALAATTESAAVVPNIDVRAIDRRTGAGDRFNAGLVWGLTAAWPLPQTLALANTCASYYVSTGDTGRPTDLIGFLEGVDSLPPDGP